MNREQVIQWARESGLIGPNDWLIDGNKIEAFAALVAAHEREEDAKLCERFGLREMHPYECAAAIRGRK